MADSYKLIEKWNNLKALRIQAEKWAEKEVTSAYAGMDMGSRAPDSFNRALGEVVLRNSDSLVKETIAYMREQERQAFLEAMPNIQQLTDALARFKKGIAA